MVNVVNQGRNPIMTINLSERYETAVPLIVNLTVEPEAKANAQVERMGSSL